MTYETIQTDGTRAPFKPAGKRPSLAEMQKIVGGYIERVTIKGGEMWVNEEGLIRSLPLNPIASIIAGQPICGDVLVCRRARPRPRGEKFQDLAR